MLRILYYCVRKNALNNVKFCVKYMFSTGFSLLPSLLWRDYQYQPANKESSQNKQLNSSFRDHSLGKDIKSPQALDGFWTIFAKKTILPIEKRIGIAFSYNSEKLFLREMESHHKPPFRMVVSFCIVQPLVASNAIYEYDTPGFNPLA
jgi:hypothetical protein